MTFRREVYDRMWLITIEQGSQLCPVADVDLRERVARVSTSLWDRGEIGSVRQLIDVDHVCAGLIEQYLITANPIKPAPPATNNVFPSKLMLVCTVRSYAVPEVER